jgi:hypothetical protein
MTDDLILHGGGRTIELAITASEHLVERLERLDWNATVGRAQGSRR